MPRARASVADASVRAAAMLEECGAVVIEGLLPRVAYMLQGRGEVPPHWG